jgi:hypothetical protein
VNKDKKPLSVTHPELAKEADGWDPTIISGGSHHKLNWMCPVGHKWSASVNNRSHGKTNCPICSNHKVLIGYNDLATTHPELSKQAHGWDPTTVVAGTQKKLNWICSKGHVYSSTGAHRIENKNCPFCSNQKLLIGYNDLATTHPELSKQAHGWDPTTVVAGTNSRREWKCEKKHIWISVVASRAILNRGCPICTNKQVLAGFNDLATTHHELSKQAHGWDPATVTFASDKQKEWKCEQGHTWNSRVADRTSGNGCPICSNKKVLVGYNDLATTNPELAIEAFGWDPTTVSYGQRRKFEWICEQGHKWIATVNDRSTGYGCPSCALSGFDPNQSGFIYFLVQPNWEIYQIGITNFPEDRLQRHKRNGFDLLELRGPMDGHTAQELETALLRYLKSQKANLSPEHIAGKFDGYSESWTIDSYKVNNLKELIDKASEAGF